MHGRWPAAFAHDADSLSVNGRRMRLTQARRIEELPLRRARASTWCSTARASSRRRRRCSPTTTRASRKVIVSAPVKEAPALNIVYGVNHHDYDPARHHLVTAASCTTNCLAPVVKVLHEEIGIEHGSITTIHDVTNTQTMVDRPAKDPRRARSALLNLIPTTTGSATAITLIYPELKGRLNGHAVRVPLLNASLTDCVFEMERATTVEEVNGLFETWSLQKPQGHPGLRAAAAGLVRFPQRPALGHHRRAVDDGRQRHAGEGLRLVRQRVGLCLAHGRHRPHGRGSDVSR